MSAKLKKVYVVGAGLFGLTIAENIVRNHQIPVEIIEKRNKIGGNAASFFDDVSKIEVHEYGSHIFHTSNLKVIEYVSNFSSFTNYKHKAWAEHNKILYEFPINLNTINKFFGKEFTKEQAENFIAAQAAKEGVDKKSLEGKAISSIGRDLYEAFIMGYTQKQWQCDPKLLSSNIISRLPFTFENQHEYFIDSFQGLPTLGYQSWFLNMTASPLISISLGTDFFDIRDQLDPDDLLVYTGAIDRYFDFNFGALGWRTLDFEREILETSNFQNVPVINYPDLDVPYTRIHEFKHLHPERNYPTQQTIVYKEFSRFAEKSDDPYYPIKSEENLSRLTSYRIASKAVPNVIFGGRLGTYQYLDMDMAIASALTVYNNQILPRLQN